MKISRAKIKLNGENISVTYLYSIKQNMKLLKYYKSKRIRIKILKETYTSLDTYTYICIYNI